MLLSTCSRPLRQVRLISLLLFPSCSSALARLDANTASSSLIPVSTSSSVSITPSSTAFASCTVTHVAPTTTTVASTTLITFSNTMSTPPGSTPITSPTNIDDPTTASQSPPPPPDLATLCAGRTGQLTCIDPTHYIYCHLTSPITAPDPATTCTDNRLSPPPPDTITVPTDPHDKSQTLTLLKHDPVNQGVYNGRFHVCGATDKANPRAAAGNASAAHDWAGNHLTCTGRNTYTYCESLASSPGVLAPSFNLPKGKKCDGASGSLIAA